MKKLAVKKDSTCMACLACVSACSNAFYKDIKNFDETKSSIQIVSRNGEAKPAVCVQCGKCAKSCEAGAITQNAKGVYIINKKLCTQCGKCVDVCPFHVIVKAEGVAASKCIACGICVKACPVEILEIVEK